MTIASEITRLQWAKASAKTSIENKGVSVPASAKVDDYHTYIDQIQQGDGGILAWWLKLYNNFVDGKDGTPSIRSSISWVEDNKYYGCCVCNLEWSSANSFSANVYTYRKVDTTNDMQYKFNNVSWNVSGSIYLLASNVTYWVNGENMKILFFMDTTYSSNSYFCYQALWNYKTTGTTTNTTIGRWSTTNLSDYNVDLTGYTQVSWNKWVWSVNPNKINNSAYIYLILKA